MGSINIDSDHENNGRSIDGAGPPIIIHSRPKNDNNKRTAAKKCVAFHDNNNYNLINNLNAKNNFTNGLDDYKHLGLKVLTSNTGSMTREKFPHVANHIIEHLDDNQCANGRYSFHLFDSHVSCWNPKAIYKLFKHRVIYINIFPVPSIACYAATR